jgi:hypothetical protein
MDNSVPTKSGEGIRHLKWSPLNTSRTNLKFVACSLQLLAVRIQYKAHCIHGRVRQRAAPTQDNSNTFLLVDLELIGCNSDWLLGKNTWKIPDKVRLSVTKALLTREGKIQGPVPTIHLGNPSFLGRPDSQQELKIRGLSWQNNRRGNIS